MRISSKKVVMLSICASRSCDHQQSELCTERAQKSQLWHLSGEQSTHCVLLEPNTAAEGSD